MDSRRSTADHVWYWLVGLPLLALFILPLLGLAGQTDALSLWEALRSPAVHQALWLSVGTTLLTLVCTVGFGSPLAVALVRAQRGLRLQTFLELPTVLPPAVAGLALLSVFGRQGWFGQPLASVGIQIPFTTAAVVLAQTFVAAPLYIRACAQALRAIDPLLADAAAIDGATARQYGRLVALPLMRHGIQAGIAQTAARALGEFGATALFAGSMPGKTRTMALAIYVNAQSDTASAVTMSIVLLAVALGLLWLAQPGEE